MELKHPNFAEAEAMSSFNRTFMELKQANISIDKHTVNALIGPLWN